MIARVLCFLFVQMCGVSGAWAHAFLAGAAPSAGSQFAVAPPQLVLRFTEPVEPLFCTIEMRGPDDAPLALPPPKVADPGAQALVVSLPKLRPGIYTVIWHATSIDTHKTEGRFQFTIGP